jgi:hypothetical protein
MGSIMVLVPQPTAGARGKKTTRGEKERRRATGVLLLLCCWPAPGKKKRLKTLRVQNAHLPGENAQVARNLSKIT